MTAVILANGNQQVVASNRQRVRGMIESGWRIVAFVRLGVILKLDDLTESAAA